MSKWKKLAEEVLVKHVDKESMDEMSENVWGDMLDAMEEHASNERERQVGACVKAYMDSQEIEGESRVFQVARERESIKKSIINNQ